MSIKTNTLAYKKREKEITKMSLMFIRFVVCLLIATGLFLWPPGQENYTVFRFVKCLIFAIGLYAIGLAFIFVVKM